MIRRSGQIQAHKATGSISARRILRAFIRHDPDVILRRETRDKGRQHRRGSRSHGPHGFTTLNPNYAAG